MTEEETEEGTDVPRVGVFVCHCGTNIGGFVDVPAVVEYIRTVENVVHAEGNLYTCASDGIASIKRAIKEHDLNRVVVASCTPRTHATLFMTACEEAGLNPYLFEFVNIRDQCSWVHMGDKEKATLKAMDLVRMGVAKASLLEPLERIEISMEHKALVIGGGVSGMTAAASIADNGLEVYLVEKEPTLGGLVREFHRIYPSNIKASELLEPLISSVEDNDLVHVMRSTRVKEVSGYVGNFEITVVPAKGGDETRFKVGVIIVATGAEVLDPKGIFGYGDFGDVINQLELERRLREGKIDDLKDVVMIQCTGTRGQRDLTYCSRICCMTAIKNAVAVKELRPDVNITVLYRDIQTFGVNYELLHEKARALGVRFVKYELERAPKVEEMRGGRKKLRVDYYDILIGRQSSILCDHVVLSSGLVQHQDALDLAKILRVPTGKDKFFFEAHVKLRPVDFATDGIFLCGTAHGPKDINDCMIQALGASGRALTLLKNESVVSEPIVSFVNEDRCTGCGTCVGLCPYNAIEMTEDDKARVVFALCKGCGICTSSCPEMAIDMFGFTTRQIMAQMETALQEKA